MDKAVAVGEAIGEREDATTCGLAPLHPLIRRLPKPLQALAVWAAFVALAVGGIVAEAVFRRKR